MKALKSAIGSFIGLAILGSSCAWAQGTPPVKDCEPLRKAAVEARKALEAAEADARAHGVDVSDSMLVVDEPKGAAQREQVMKARERYDKAFREWANCYKKWEGAPTHKGSKECVEKGKRYEEFAQESRDWRAHHAGSKGDNEGSASPKRDSIDAAEESLRKSYCQCLKDEGVDPLPQICFDFVSHYIVGGPLPPTKSGDTSKTPPPPPPRTPTNTPPPPGASTAQSPTPPPPPPKTPPPPPPSPPAQAAVCNPCNCKTMNPPKKCAPGSGCPCTK